MSLPIPFDNSYARLPERFFARVAPARPPAPRLLCVNDALAAELGIDPAWLRGEAGLDMLSGRALPPGAEPIALAYAGHQFGNFVPQLGDGRAILLGEVIDRSGRRRDIQLKGAGRTPFSRSGDGRAALGPVLREYLVAEAMHALGIPTTRALGAVLTGEDVQRQMPLPGAVLTRVAASHIRTGTFQYFAVRGDEDALRLLVDHALARHFPEAPVEGARPAAVLLQAVAAAQAELVAHWLSVGFIHGVMNTDNMAISGETIDYGPCAFMDAYDPETVFSSIDMRGRYAFGRQPATAQWNLVRLAESLLPLLADDPSSAVETAESALAGFVPRFEAAWGARLMAKLGLAQPVPDDVALVDDLLALLQGGQADWTLFFRRLGAAAVGETADLAALFAQPEALVPWLARWQARIAGDDPAAVRAAMDRVNPALIPRNHRVEAALAAATEREDMAPFQRLVQALSTPFALDTADAELALPPLPHERVAATFCGT